MKAILSKDPAVTQANRVPERVSETERELAFARAIIQSPDLHEEATLRAACRLLSTVGIAEDRRNAEKALAQLSQRPTAAEPEPALQPPADSFAADSFAMVEGIPAWLKGVLVTALLLAIVVAPFLLR